MALTTDTTGMSSLLMQAAQSAAQADGLVPPPLLDGTGDGMSKASVVALQQARSAIAAHHHQQQNAAAAVAAAAAAAAAAKKKGPPLRRGKWTPEEEAYANRLIQEFKAGLLPLTDGTTLRTFLSKLLNCDPMRISKKFVGSNCIGKQVFRRRNADLNRLTPDQIQKSRAELSELERRFLERVAQTNRVKSGVGAPPPIAATTANIVINGTNGSQHNTLTGGDVLKNNDMDESSAGGFQNNAAANNVLYINQNVNYNVVNGMEPSTLPWLQPPLGYKHGNGAAFAAAHLSSANSRAAAAGRALLEGNAAAAAAANQFKDAYDRKQNQNNNDKNGAGQFLVDNSSSASWGSSAMLAELQKRASGNNFGNLMGNTLNSSNFLSATGSSSKMSNNAFSHLAQSASAARLGLSSNASINQLMLKAGLSREQISQLARERGMSSSSLSNIAQRQNSFDALMSLDFQSLQSIDNLANLMQTGSGAGGHLPESGLKNADFGSGSRQNIAGTSNEELSLAMSRLASAGRMESLLKSMSSNNSMGGIGSGAIHANSNANISNLLQSMQSNGSSTSNLFGGGGGQSAVNLANFLRQDSSTGLTALRLQDGLNQRNSSVDDFLSLVAAGDIPHQDPSLLNVPLVQQQQHTQQIGGGPTNSQEAAAKLLAQQQILSNNAALANALASRSLGSFHGLGVPNHDGNSNPQFQTFEDGGSKRKLEELGDYLAQGSSKRQGS